MMTRTIFAVSYRDILFYSSLGELPQLFLLFTGKMTVLVAQSVIYKLSCPQYIEMHTIKLKQNKKFVFSFFIDIHVCYPYILLYFLHAKVESI